MQSRLLVCIILYMRARALIYAKSMEIAVQRANWKNHCDALKSVNPCSTRSTCSRKCTYTVCNANARNNACWLASSGLMFAAKPASVPGTSISVRAPLCNSHSPHATDHRLPKSVKRIMAMFVHFSIVMRRLHIWIDDMSLAAIFALMHGREAQSVNVGKREPKK